METTTKKTKPFKTLILDYKHSDNMRIVQSDKGTSVLYVYNGKEMIGVVCGTDLIKLCQKNK